jgi:amidophosphoribosyltransferase
MQRIKSRIRSGRCSFKATSDSEVILRFIQKNLDLGLRGAIKATMEK